MLTQLNRKRLKDFINDMKNMDCCLRLLVQAKINNLSNS